MTPKAESEAPSEAAAPAVPNLRERQETTAAVLSRATRVDELDDGYALFYPRSKAWSRRLESFQGSWRKSCPQMTFEVAPDGEGLRLEIRGPEGTKAFVDGARYMLTSHINPAPTLSFKLRQGLRLATSPLRRLPDFLIIGAKKCGTTALYSYLTQHPAVVPAFKKEIYYFNAFYGKGRNWYRSFFPTRFTPRRLLTGEATPDYLFHPHAAARIQATVPQARLLAILRNPVDRAYSFYNHNLRAGLETLSFEDAIDQEEQRLAGEQAKVEADPDYFSFAYMHHSYKKRGLYLEQLSAWNEHFPRAQMCVLGTDDLYQRPEQTLRRALEFLGLPYSAPAEFKKLNAAPYYPEMDPRTRARLEEYFAPYNRELYEFLGADLGW